METTLGIVLMITFHRFVIRFNDLQLNFIAFPFVLELYIRITVSFVKGDFKFTLHVHGSLIFRVLLTIIQFKYYFVLISL